MNLHRLLCQWMFEWRISVELENSSIPLNRIEWNVEHFVATMQLCTLASSYDFRINGQNGWKRISTKISHRT
ncbi:CLUMA_CG018605, isoform A [Clunio marinus]|uniref:CLUMA_CG018605, isoform A n=1 Tax=Clunio marinus TaxID=568069 RepID=A0A1J1IY90_9DIPT|nr:CLUMA_CG018605, isoform A [Clunio marinus]